MSLRYLSSCLSSPQFSTKWLYPPSEFQCYWFVHCTHLLPSLDFPCPSVQIIMFLDLLAQHMVILPWSSTGLWHLQPPHFCIILLIITICYTGFYLGVPCASLLSTFSLTCPCHLLHYWVWHIPALHVLFLPCNSAGLWLLPSYFFVLDYPFINQILSFLPPTYLTWVFSFVSLSWSISLSLSLSL